MFSMQPAPWELEISSHVSDVMSGNEDLPNYRRDGGGCDRRHRAAALWHVTAVLLGSSLTHPPHWILHKRCMDLSLFVYKFPCFFTHWPQIPVDTSQGLYLHRTARLSETKGKHFCPKWDSNSRSSVRVFKAHALDRAATGSAAYLYN